MFSSSHRRCSTKKPGNLSKKRLNHVNFLKFEEHLFYRKPQVAASEYSEVASRSLVLP